jgi:glyoxylase-like metal-dependent hydrolase (beta-lactamase superfamily II)
MEQLRTDILVVGPLGVNCVVLACAGNGEGVVIDPGSEAERICSAVARHGIRVKAVLNTHGHFDHVGGNAGVTACSGAPLLIHPADVPYLSRAAASAANYGLVSQDSPAPDGSLEQGLEIVFGDRRLQVLHTPGHTPGGCCFYLPEDGLLISGDTLFAESVGRTDLPGGDHRTLINSITGRLMSLGDDVRVIPGHGPDTTIGHERRHNPYLQGL